MIRADEYQQWVDHFVSNLEKLPRGDLGRLKRCAGRPLSECAETYPIFYRMLPAEVRGRERWEEAFFLTCTLFPSAPGRFTGDLGQSLRVIAERSPAGKEGLDRRMSILLDCSRDGLPFRLRQTVRFVGSHDVGVDWRQTLLDLMRWDWEGRPVQKKWARSFFGGKAQVNSVDHDVTDIDDTEERETTDAD